MSTLPEYVKYIFNYAIMVAGLVALGALIWAGILYLTSAGDPSKIKEARERILAAVVGLTILLSSYLILATINPQLLIFELPFLTPLIPEKSTPPPMVITEEASLIVEELPLGQTATKGLWEETKTLTMKILIEDFENFLNQETKVNDSFLGNDAFGRISDLNKYLKTLTDECRCENVRSFSTTPETGALPVGCSGDPCQIDQDIEVESGSARGRMDKVLAIDRAKIKDLLNYQGKINIQKDILREELRKFQEIEGGVIACQNQNKELMTLNDYLTTKQSFEEMEDLVVKIRNYFEPKGDPLTFYCSVGGTIFDYPYTPEREEISFEELEEIAPFEFSEISLELTHCPLKLPVGEVIDELRELAVITLFKLEKVSLLIGEMTKQIQEMTELVSQCNETQCGASSVCVPNPCYLCCSPIPCTFCVPFCLSPCLQAVGGCHGDACPVEEITKKSEEIKKTEEKILETIGEIKEIFPRVSFLLKDPKNPSNLNNLSTSVGLCYSSDIENPDWVLLNCEQARGNYGPTGQIMTDCYPRNFYCCTFSEENLTKPLFSVPGKEPPIYIIPAKKFQPLPSENNCPKGWLCNQDVKYYNQYNDASEPLKQLLSCMRNKLDRIQQGEGIENVLGQISSISDAKLYQGTCDWEAGTDKPGGCSHLYETKHGKERISSHYGGIYCRYDHQSYAVDIDVSTDFQKKYADEVVKSAKECFPGAYILDKTDHIHIDIGEVYHCASNDS